MILDFSLVLVQFKQISLAIILMQKMRVIRGLQFGIWVYFKR